MGAQDMMSLKSAIGEYGNPFLETSSDLLFLDRREIAEKYVIDNEQKNLAEKLSQCQLTSKSTAQ